MKLNHPGIYRIIGENDELLANIVGEVPCLRITSALLKMCIRDSYDSLVKMPQNMQLKPLNHYI